MLLFVVKSGYSIPTEDALFISPETGRHSLKFDFFTIFEDVWVEVHDDQSLKGLSRHGLRY
jgi:hypothetical protein